MPLCFFVFLQFSSTKFFLTIDSFLYYLRLSRNESEKLRRDRLNMYIVELAKLVPLVTNVNKKIDKSTILRLAVNYLRIHHGMQSLLYDELLYLSYHFFIMLITAIFHMISISTRVLFNEIMEMFGNDNHFLYVSY